MKIKVKNRTSGYTGYSVPDLNIRRNFAPGEVKVIDSEELEKLAYQRGGRLLISKFLLINNEELAKELNVQPLEPEYWMEEKEVEELLKYSSLDKLLDCLDFAPEGVIDLIKSLAVSMPLNDISKLEAIKEATGFDAAKAIQINKIIHEDDKPEEKVGRGRRVKVNPVDESAGRRVSVEEEPVIKKYNVVHRS